MPFPVATEVTDAGNAESAQQGNAVPPVMIENDKGETERAVDDTPTRIVLQPGDEPVDRPAKLSDMKVEQPNSPPVHHKVLAELEAGRARVAEHKVRAEMIAHKRDNVDSEEKQVADATEANKDL